MRSDHKVLGEFIGTVGGLSAAARKLTTNGVEHTPQTVFNWVRRKRIAAGQRLHFLTVFNYVMPKDRHLDLKWLAVRTSNRSAKNGRASRRKGQTIKARKAQGARQRGCARSGAQLR